MEIRSIALLLGIGLSAASLFASEEDWESISLSSSLSISSLSSLSSSLSISSLSSLSEEETLEAKEYMIKLLPQQNVISIDYWSHSADSERRVQIFLSEESKRAIFRVFESYSTPDGEYQQRKVEVPDALYEVERDATQEITKVSCRYGTLEEGTPVILVMEKDPESQTWRVSYTGGPFSLQLAGAVVSIAPAIQP